MRAQIDLPLHTQWWREGGREGKAPLSIVNHTYDGNRRFVTGLPTFSSYIYPLYKLLRQGIWKGFIHRSREEVKHLVFDIPL